MILLGRSQGRRAEVGKQREVRLDADGGGGDERERVGLVEGFQQARHACQVADRVVEF